MRLTCPNCRAQYDVPDTAIPDDGRDVECSNCGHSWFQAAPDAADDSGALVLDQDMTVPAELPAPKPRKLDPAVEDILRSEADRETRARKAEARIETQPDLGLNVPPPRRSAAAGRAEVFPDVDEINRTLRSASEERGLKPKPAPATMPASDPVALPPPEPTRFGAGLKWGLGISVGLVLLYLAAPKIALEIPELRVPAMAYAGTVDAAWVWFDTLLRNGGADGQ